MTSLTDKTDLADRVALLEQQVETLRDQLVPPRPSGPTPEQRAEWCRQVDAAVGRFRRYGGNVTFQAPVCRAA